MTSVRFQAWRILRGLLSLPFVLIARLVRPVIHIRFGRIRADRIGHLAIEPELYLCQRKENGNTELDLFFLDALPICNTVLADKWKEHFNIHPWVKGLYLANRLLPGWEAHEVALPDSILEERGALLDRHPPHISFTPDEIAQGEAFLEKCGCVSKPFVCVINRDSAYLKNRYPEEDWSYHDYRNSPISNFFPAITRLCNMGYRVFRMGAATSSNDFPEIPNAINYAQYHRTEFLDLYLLAKCRFILAGDAGLVSLAFALRKPTAYVDFPALAFVPGMPSDIILTSKKFRHTESGRLLPFKEAAEMGLLSGSLDSRQLERVEVVNNTPEEIEWTALEMHDHLEERTQKNKSAKELQDAFWSLFPGHDWTSGGPRICNQFLYDNRELLP